MLIGMLVELFLFEVWVMYGIEDGVICWCEL